MVECVQLMTPANPDTERHSREQRLRVWGQSSWDLLRILALAAVAVWLLYQVKLVVIPLMLGAFAASLGTPLVARLDRRRWPRLLSTWVVGLTVGGVAFLVGWFVVTEIQSAADQMAVALGEAWEQLQLWLTSGPFGAQILEAVDRFLEGLGEGDGGLGRWLTAGLGTVTEAIAGLVLTVVVAFFIVKDGDRFWGWVLSKVRPDDREQFAEAGVAAWATLRRYLFGTSLVGVVNATALAITLLILGVPLIIPLAILMFLGAFFPLLGALASGSVIALTVLATNGLRDAVIVILVVIAVQQLEGDLISPIVLGKTMALHPLLILFGVTIGFIVGGLVGAFVAVPFIAIAAQVTRTVYPGFLETGRASTTPRRPA